jgi:hypothetical protein
LGKAWVEGAGQVEHLAWRAASVLQKAVRLLEQVAEVDQECSFDILLLFVAVWRWNG